MQTSVEHRNRRAATATPESATSKLVAIGCDLVASNAGRSLKSWEAGLEIRLRDGRRFYSNSREFRAVLSAEFAHRFGCEPSPGAVTRALGILNRWRFQSKNDINNRVWALETAKNGEAIEQWN